MAQESRRLGGVDMTTGDPFQTLLRFSLPLIAGNALQQVYNMVDSSVAGNFIGMTAMSAVSNGFMIVMMITALFSGLSVGGTVLVARLFGRRDYEAIGRGVSAIYFGVAVLFLPLTLLGWFLAPALLSLFHIPPDVMPGALTYVRVIFLGLLGSMGYNVNAGVLNGLGDSRVSLRFLAVSCVANGVMDVVFVAGFHWGVFGTAFATILAQFGSWLLGVRYINRHYSFIHIGLPKRGVDTEFIRQALRIGVPSSITGLQYTVGMMMVQALVNTYDTEFIAGFSAGGKLDSFAFMAVNSFSSAMATYTAQNIGAERMDRVRSGTRVGMVLSTVVCLAMAAIFVPFGRPILRVLFGLTPAALDAAMAYIYRVTGPFFILGISYIISGVLRGAGAVTVSTVSSIISLWGVRVPLAYYIAAHWGRENLFLAYPIAWAVGLILSGVYYLSGRWKPKEKPRIESQ